MTEAVARGNVAVVTGGGSGIGRAVALAFGRRGDAVAVADIDLAAAQGTVDAIAEVGGAALACRVDVADPDAVTGLAEEVAARLGPADTLVNNAAVQVNASVLGTSYEEWRREIDVNLGGVFLCSKAFLPQLLATRGSIVNLSSVNGFYVEAGCAAYCATKAGIIGLTKAMAIDHGADGVRVNCVCPGYIDTGLAAGYFDAQADPAAARQAAGRLHALRRIGRAEEVADAVLYLAGGSAGFVTGSCLVIDGGMSAGLAPAR